MGQKAQLIIILLSLTALTLLIGALTIVEPTWLILPKTMIIIIIIIIIVI